MAREIKSVGQALKETKESAIDAVPGLRRFLDEVFAEFKRLNTQGSMELASAIFNGHAWTPYGPGQYTTSPSNGRGAEISKNEQDQSQGHER